MSSQLGLENGAVKREIWEIRKGLQSEYIDGLKIMNYHVNKAAGRLEET